jgi:ABC-2 type transport system permease protein
MNPFARGGFLWLLGFEGKLALRAWRSSKTMSMWARIGLFGLVAVVALATGYGAAFVLSSLSPQPSFSALSVIVTSLGLALIASLMMSQALLAATELVYSRRDLDLLFSSPVSPWSVMMARACGLVVTVALLYLAVVAALLVWAPFMDMGRWWVLAPGVFGLALWMTALGLLLAKALLGWIGLRNTRVVGQILAALIGASIFLASQSTNFMPQSERDAHWRSMAERMLSTEIDAAHPLWIPARATLGDPIAMALFLGLGLIVFLAAAFWFSRGFVADAAAAAALGAPKRRDTGRVKRLHGGLTMAVIRKEWRLLRRDPLLLSQVGLQIVYLLPLMFVLWSAAARGGEEGSAMSILLGSAFVVLAAMLGGSLAWITASAEDAPELIAAAPVTRSRVELGKLIAAVTPVILVMLIPAAAMAMNTPIHALYVMLGATAAATSAALIGIWHQTPAIRREFSRQRKTSWVASIGQTLVATAWSGATALALWGIPGLAFIPSLIAIGLTLALQDSKPRLAP